MRGRQLLLGLAAVLVVGLLLWAQGSGEPEPIGGSTTADTSVPTSGPDSGSVDGLPVVTEDDLPAEARGVLDRIHAGGPFKYDRDGIVFENREELLPDHPRGYYREYTVEIRPGDRGPWRIVVGDAGEFYWTEDHYESFSVIERTGT